MHEVCHAHALMCSFDGRRYAWTTASLDCIANCRLRHVVVALAASSQHSVQQIYASSVDETWAARIP